MREPAKKSTMLQYIIWAGMIVSTNPLEMATALKG